MTHPGHPALPDPLGTAYDARDKINRALYKVKVVTKTAAFTADPTEATHYLCDSTGGAFTVTLPDPQVAGGGNQELFFHFKRTNSGIGVDVTIQSAGGRNIDGGASVLLTSQYARMNVYSDTTQWWRLTN